MLRGRGRLRESAVDHQEGVGEVTIGQRTGQGDITIAEDHLHLSLLA